MDLKERLESLRAVFPQKGNGPERGTGGIERTVQGESVSTPFGTCYRSVSEFPADHRQGDVSILQFSHLDPDVLVLMGKDEALGAAGKGGMLFLDTETTGLAGGAGTVAFLAGLGYFTETGFRIEQYFMRDHTEESALLHALGERIREFRSLASYNGKAYDMNVLASRFIISRMEPLPRLPHLDLLFTVRRLWRRRLCDCSLMNVERSVLGFKRDHDVPGYLIPGIFFDFLRTGRGDAMAAVFDHNRLDILSLAALAGLTGQIYQGNGLELEHPSDILSLAKAFLTMRLFDQAAGCLERIASGESMTDRNHEALELLGYALKRLGRWERAADVWERMTRRPLSVVPFEELAKYLEHRKKAPRDAMRVVERAFRYLEIQELSGPPHPGRERLLYRYERLRRKMK